MFNLNNLTLDELSLVDRPANPAAMVSLFKRDNGENMTDINKQLEEAQAEMVAAGSILPEVIARQQSTEEGEQLQPTAQPAEAVAVEESQEVEAEASESTEGMTEEERDTGITTRLGRRILKPSRYVAVTKVSQKEWKQEATDKAIKEELTMLIEELTALRAVKRAAI